MYGEMFLEERVFITISCSGPIRPEWVTQRKLCYMLYIKDFDAVVCGLFPEGE